MSLKVCKTKFKKKYKYVAIYEHYEARFLVLPKVTGQKNQPNIPTILERIKRRFGFIFVFQKFHLKTNKQNVRKICNIEFALDFRFMSKTKSIHSGV